MHERKSWTASWLSVSALAMALAIALLAAACSDGSEVRAGPDSTGSTTFPAGPLAKVGSNAYFLTAHGGKVFLARVSKDGTSEEISGLPIAGSPAIAGIGNALLVTGTRGADGCTADCSSKEYVALWVSEAGKVETTSVLKKEEGPLQDADSVAFLGASQDRIWFAVPGETVVTSSTGDELERGPEIDGVACVLSNELAVATGTVVKDGTRPTVQYALTNWRSKVEEAKSEPVTIDSSAQLACADEAIYVVAPNGAPQLMYTRSSGWSYPASSDSSSLVGAQPVPGQPLVSLDRSGHVFVWHDGAPKSTTVSFAFGPKLPIPPSIYAGVDTSTITACVNVTEELSPPSGPNDPPTSKATRTCKVGER